MVIVQLYGGLGNQMFQYATGRALAKRLSTRLKLDVHIFESYKLHEYSLHGFHIREKFAKPHEVRRIQGKHPGTFERLGRRIGLFQLFPDFSPTGRILREDSNGYNADLPRETGNVYLEGYWQSEKYFKGIRDVLLEEFTVKYEQDAKSREISRMIRDTNSASLHVRRKDYIDDPKTNQKHGVCSVNYYHRGVQHILERVKDPHFFIFSDDPFWIRENLHLDVPTTIVDHNDRSRNYEDFRLMSQCKHNIIANSSFSWWAAWLGKAHDKIVIAPKRWFQDPQYEDCSPAPENWIAF